jgi:hypothetical protein
LRKRNLSLQLGVYRNETNQQLALAKSVKITQDPPRHSAVDREEGANEKLLQYPSPKSCPLSHDGLGIFALWLESKFQNIPVKSPLNKVSWVGTLGVSTDVARIVSPGGHSWN